MKGEYSDRVWFCFQFGYYLADADMPSTAEGLFNRLNVPPSDPRYADKCQQCPGGGWQDPSKPLPFTSYILNSK